MTGAGAEWRAKNYCEVKKDNKNGWEIIRQDRQGRVERGCGRLWRLGSVRGKGHEWLRFYEKEYIKEEITGVEAELGGGWGVVHDVREAEERSVCIYVCMYS